MQALKKRPYELLVFDLQGTLAENGRLLEGVPDMLKQLKSRSYLIAAATNWGQSGLNQLLKYLPADFSFDAVRHAGQAHSKPHPQMLLEILSELNRDPSDTLMIGDTVSDIQFAKNAKVDVLAVSYSGSPKALLAAHNPIACIDSIEALKAWFYL